MHGIEIIIVNAGIRKRIRQKLSIESASLALGQVLHALLDCIGGVGNHTNGLALDGGWLLG